MRLGLAAIFAIVAAVVSPLLGAEADRAIRGEGTVVQGWMSTIDASPVRYITGISMSKG